MASPPHLGLLAPPPRPPSGPCAHRAGAIQGGRGRGRSDEDALGPPGGQTPRPVSCRAHRAGAGEGGRKRGGQSGRPRSSKADVLPRLKSWGSWAGSRQGPRVRCPTGASVLPSGTSLSASERPPRRAACVSRGTLHGSKQPAARRCCPRRPPTLYNIGTDCSCLRAARFHPTAEAVGFPARFCKG